MQQAIEPPLSIDPEVTGPEATDSEAAGRNWFQIGIVAGIIIGIVLAVIVAGRLARQAPEPPMTDPDAPV